MTFNPLRLTHPPFLEDTKTGTISLSKWPAFCACSVLFWDRTATLSWSSLLTCHCLATFSAVKEKNKHFQDSFWHWLKHWWPTPAGPLAGWDSPLWHSCLPPGVERLQGFLRSCFLSLLPSFSFPFYKIPFRNFLLAASPIGPIFWPHLPSHLVSEPFDGKL